jgi:hypothetical protein
MTGVVKGQRSARTSTMQPLVVALRRQYDQPFTPWLLENAENFLGMDIASWCLRIAFVELALQ